MNLNMKLLRPIFFIVVSFLIGSWTSNKNNVTLKPKKEIVTFPNDLTKIACKKNYTFMVSYNALKKREIVVEIWKGGEWIHSGKKVIKKGEGMTFVDVNMDQKLIKGTDYSLRVQLRPIGGTWNQLTAYFEIPEVTVR
ncbi:hypothetical protein [Aquimarina agarilytica]|uniref:hypothetical protein n=1 Tax=Aquimarina agarilytica TaxID=1087449 RepID=UPI00028912E3|nr:hypothetical protein [Aquimarina agarilytica]